MDDIVRIAGYTDRTPTREAMVIAYAYHRIALDLGERVGREAANWFCFAVWSSKAIGESLDLTRDSPFLAEIGARLNVPGWFRGHFRSLMLGLLGPTYQLALGLANRSIFLETGSFAVSLTRPDADGGRDGTNRALRVRAPSPETSANGRTEASALITRTAEAVDTDAARPGGHMEDAGGGRAEGAGLSGQVEDAGLGGRVEGAGSGGQVEGAGSGGRTEAAGLGGRAEGAGSGGRVEGAGLGGRVEDAGAGGRAEGAGSEGARLGGRVEDAGSGGRVEEAGSGRQVEGAGPGGRAEGKAGRTVGGAVRGGRGRTVRRPEFLSELLAPADEQHLDISARMFRAAIAAGDPAERAELLLGANIALSAYEQARAQRALELVLYRPIRWMLRVSWRSALATLTRRPVHRLRLYTAPHEDQPFLTRALEDVWAKLYTRYVMSLRTPVSEIRLGKPLVPPPGVDAEAARAPIENAEVRALAERFAAATGDGAASGVANWLSYRERMRFIVSYFRLYLAVPDLFRPPFDPPAADELTAEMELGEAPEPYSEWFEKKVRRHERRAGRPGLRGLIVRQFYRSPVHIDPDAAELAHIDVTAYATPRPAGP